MAVYGSFLVHLVGVVKDVEFSTLDPSSRTDILRALDAALLNPSNSLLHRWDKVDCWVHSLCLFDTSLEVKDINDITLLTIPYKILASFSQIEESSVQLIIFYLGPKKKQRDLAVLCVSDQRTASEVCGALQQRLESLYRLCSERTPITENISDPSSASMQRTQPILQLESAVDSVTESLKSAQAEQALEKITKPLVDQELQQFAELYKTFKNNHITIQELITFLNEMYGPQRNHLLYQIQFLISAVERPDALRTLKEMNIPEK